MTPELIIIAGPNGCGKSTLAEILKSKGVIQHFINADTIALGIGNTPKSDIEAGRILLKRLSELIPEGRDFAFESTMAGKNWIKLIRLAKENGYRIGVFFVVVTDAETAINRVRERAKKGGHSIPDDVVRRRFGRSLAMFQSTYCRLVNQWTVFDNSNSSLKIIATCSDQKLEILDSELLKSYFTEELSG